MLVQSRTLYFIYANHILSYIEQKETYLFSDLQYVSYPTPLYFVDFTNKASLFFFSTAGVCLVLLELGAELCLRPGFLSPSGFAAGHA